MPVKVVILWAGQGRRIQKEYGGLHKAMIPLNGEPLMLHLLRNVKAAGADELVPVLGYRGDELLNTIHNFGEFSSIIPVWNPDYEKTNNLASLMCAEQILTGDEFVVVNGDMVFDYRILQKMISIGGNAIATDANDYGYQLDSPRELIKDGRILDIGRHRTIEESQGYAAGMYRFSASFSQEYFSLGKKLTLINPNAGYHEPLIGILDRVNFVPCYTENYRWMDVDEKEDVVKAETMLNALRSC